MSKPRSTLLVAATVAVIVALTALFAQIGADARWLAALGHLIAERKGIPDGIPFAGAPTGHWHNAVVLAELIFYALERAFGDRGLMLAQLVAVAGAMTVLIRDARTSGAEAPGTCAALLLVALGAFSSFAIVRVQLFSLVMFPVLVWLLRTDARAPTQRIWLAVPLLALWSNLHGAALLGLGTVLVYLAFARLRREPRLAVGVGLASILSLCLTPALAGTPDYYYGQLTNLAAQSGQGMWGRLSLSSPLDVVLILAALGLIAAAWRARPALWEMVTAGALALLTVQASRNGVWLLLFLAPTAARAIRPKRTWEALAPVATAVSAAAIVLAVVHGPAPGGANQAVVSRALALAHGSPVLAEDEIAEQVALAGGRVWVADPIDAFSRSDQAEYLDWLAGTPDGRQALAPQVKVVLVFNGTPVQRLMADTGQFTVVGGDRTTSIYERLPLSDPATRASEG